MRLTIITSWATDVTGGSGTAVFYQSLVKGLAERGYDLDIIAPNFDVSDYVGVTLQRIHFNTRLTTDPRIQQADVLIGLDYDGFGLDPVQRPPLIASAHAVFGDVLQWETGEIATMVKAQAFFDQIMMQNADVVTIGSHYAKSRITDLYGVAPHKIDVIYHGMIDQTWMRLAETMPRTPNDHPVILSVGKMYPRKRTDVLLRAMPHLLERHPSLELRIAGDGLMYSENLALAAQLGIADHVTFLGHVDDDMTFAHEWVQADVFVHPSSQETFGFVYLEAMRLGKPVVAVRAGAAPEVVDGSGRLAEPENPAALAAEIDFFLTHERARETYGRWAQTRARHFTHSAMIDGYEQAIERAIAVHERVNVR
ncbi:MAG: glycosyltransferase family 4 protein [bacterium]|nr:glycosyltransferase family 4 protein [bacterium]